MKNEKKLYENNFKDKYLSIKNVSQHLSKNPYFIDFLLFFNDFFIFYIGKK